MPPPPEMKIVVTLRQVVDVPAKSGARDEVLAAAARGDEDFLQQMATDLIAHGADEETVVGRVHVRYDGAWRQQYREPATEKGSRSGETVEYHPAYAMIGASRVTQTRVNRRGEASGGVLFGSDFDHDGYIVITIREAELHRTLNRDWPFGRREICEVALSEAQWAAFVSTLNVGQGVQCTLQAAADRGQVPQIPHPPDRRAQFVQEMTDDVREAVELIQQVRAELALSKLSQQTRRDLDHKLDVAAKTFADREPWVAQQFDEHIENVTEHAKAEVAAYLQGAVTRAGLKALGAVEPPMRLVTGDDNDSNEEGR